MADVTTPTNTLAIRQDRMAMLTERDRVIERLDRLERAGRDGLFGAGGSGSGGIADTAWQSQAYGAATTAVTGWKLTPIPADASFLNLRRRLLRESASRHQSRRSFDRIYKRLGS